MAELPSDRLRVQARHLKTIVGLCRRHLPLATVWAFGSRVSGTNVDGSDLDLVVRHAINEAEPTPSLAPLRAAFEASTIPFFVDLSSWTDLPEWLRADIEREHVVLIDERANTE